MELIYLFNALLVGLVIGYWKGLIQGMRTSSNRAMTERD